ncbi:hypothetical protein PIB30_027467 [Stylosanthes scabra]|uniref:CCHC-type domain-containing protein n=1 Tax=Stylosanthes scabra TaxID=79078 RepID=A0ABU6Z950_9FABA|nr:hypothetical protein [Stylosanthes scabra]
MDSIRTTYSHFIKPVNSEHYSTSTGAPKTLPPPIKRLAHRLAKKRRVDVAAEREMHAHKVRKTFEVTCSRCGQQGHYYRTCKNPPLDPNWKPFTKKNRELQKGSQEKAKKNKKKMLLKPGVRVKPPKQRAQNDEIPISQNAPHVEEHQNGSQNLGQGVESSSYSLGNQATTRMKQPIVRPQIPPATTTIRDNSQNHHDNGPRGVSVETMAATSSGTAARLFKYMPTPKFNPPRQK